MLESPAPLLLTAEALQDPSCLVRFLVQCRRPESLSAKFVRQFVDRCSQLIDQCEDLVESLLPTCLRLVPDGGRRHCGVSVY